MKKRRAILSGLDLSVLGFGCWSVSGPKVWNTSTDEKSFEAIHKALDLGINFFDVAPVYGFGHAEAILGQALGQMRKDVFIATKCGLLWDDEGNIRNCLKPQSIYSEIDESLKRLNTDYVDLYQMHWPDTDTPIEDSMEALLKIQESGKIRNIGVSNFSVPRTKRAMACSPIVSHQGLYNMLQRNADDYHGISLEYKTEEEILPFCKTTQQAFFAYSPLCQGLLSERSKNGLKFDEKDIRSNNPELRGEKLNENMKKVELLRALSHKIGRPLNHLAINWLLSKNEVTCVLLGTSNPIDLEDNAAALKWQLDDATITEINAIL